MPKHGPSRRAVFAATGALAGAAALPRWAFAQANKATPITIANASGSMSQTMQEMIKEQGFLEQFGIQANMLSVADGSKIVGGIIGGEIDMSMMSGFSQIFAADEKGGRIKVLGGAATLPSLAVFTTKPEIRTLKDLEERTVGTGSLGALIHQLMVALLRKHGVDVSKVRFVNIGASVDVFRAVTRGTVDAGPGDVTIIGQQDAFHVRLVEHGDMSAELAEYTYQGAWTSEPKIQAKRDAIVRTLAAFAKLFRFVQTPDAKDAFMKARSVVFSNAKNTEAEAQWAYIQKYKPFAVNIALSEERLRYMQQLNVDLKIQSRVLPFETVADMSLARDAVALLK